MLDLATHHSGLPSWPDNLKPADPENPLADYRVADLYAFLSKHGVARKPDVSFEYSNFGYSLLAEALANRTRTAFPDLLRQQITGPLGLRDTVVPLSDEQAGRLIQGHDTRHRPVHRWDMDAMAGAGGIRSTAGDMLTYLEVQLHPEETSGGSLAAAISQTHKLRTDLAENYWIALAWFYSVDNGTYWHNGATGGYSSYAFFHPKADYAAIVLVNQAAGLASLLADQVRQRSAGAPAISLENVVIPARTGFLAFARFFAAYWLTMFTAGAFTFCFVLGLQGVAAQLLPRYLFLRLSALLQLARVWRVHLRIHASTDGRDPRSDTVCPESWAGLLVSVVLVPGTLSATEWVARAGAIGSAGLDRLCNLHFLDCDGIPAFLFPHDPQNC